MALLRLQDVSLSFGGPALLDQVNLSIEPRERICLIGRNGEGKSTLLKVLLGQHIPDSGERILQKGTVISQLEQDVPNDIDQTLYEVVASGLDHLGVLLNDYHQHSQHGDPEDPNWLTRLASLQKQLEDQNGWHFQQQIETVLSKLDLDGEANFADLSGGMKRRALLAKALVQQPDILLLDEPTNHLDIDAILWLEEFLKSFNGSILFITHDRTFLRSLATRIVELDRGDITNYPGNYDKYLVRKQEMLDAEEAENARFDKRLAQEEVWIRQGIKARRTRNEGRVRALEKMREAHKQRRNRQGTAKLALETAQTSGKRVVEAENISFSYGNNTLIKPFSVNIQRGDKIGIIGPNGVGKSTLLKLLLGQLEPTEGKLKQGTNLEIAYFDQLRGQLDLEKNVRDNLDQGSDNITVNGKSKHVISYLQDFLFSPQRIHSPVSSLSGGERNRLLLAKLFMKPANILVLDEPTNDLDMETLELLEELLLDFKGTLLLVSHDRSFLDNVVTSSIVFEGHGKLQEYVGGYQDWLNHKKALSSTATTNTSNNTSPKKSKHSEPTTTQQKQPAKKLSYKVQRELEQLPALIESLEEKIQSLHDSMASADFYKQTAEHITKAQDDLASSETELEAAYARWEALEQ